MTPRAHVATPGTSVLAELIDVFPTMAELWAPGSIPDSGENTGSVQQVSGEQ